MFRVAHEKIRVVVAVAVVVSMVCDDVLRVSLEEVSVSELLEAVSIVEVSVAVQLEVVSEIEVVDSELVV